MRKICTLQHGNKSQFYADDGVILLFFGGIADIHIFGGSRGHGVRRVAAFQQIHVGVQLLKRWKNVQFFHYRYYFFAT